MSLPTVTIVGAGALGSNLVMIGRNWPARLQVLDFDRVESKNVSSQFHTHMGMGKNKAVALQAAMRGLFKAKIEACPVRLVEDNLKEMLGMSTLIVDCTDNYESRALIQRYAEWHGNVQILHCCLSAGGDLARVVWTEHFSPDYEGEHDVATCEDGRNLPFHIQAAALTAQVVQRYLEVGERFSWQLTPYHVLRIA